MINNRDNPQSFEKIFFILMNATTDLIILIDTNGTILFINNTDSQFFGLPLNGTVGSNIFKFLSDTEKRYVEIILQTQKPQSFAYKKDEEIFLNNYFPILNNSNQVDQIVLFIKNITKIQKLEDDLIGILEEKHKRVKFDFYDDLEQHLTGMLYLLMVLKKKICDSDKSDEPLISQLYELHKEAIQKLKKFS